MLMSQRRPSNTEATHISIDILISQSQSCFFLSGRIHLLEMRIQLFLEFCYFYIEFLSLLFRVINSHLEMTMPSYTAIHGPLIFIFCIKLVTYHLESIIFSLVSITGAQQQSPSFHVLIISMFLLFSNTRVIVVA